MEWPMQYWLVKQEPEAYAWETFLREGKTRWEGVRNYQARNNLRAMRLGDPVLFYASVTTKAVLGVAEVSKEAFTDPTAEDGDWSAVELKAVRTLPRQVTLEEVKAEPALAKTSLLRNSRLSVQPLTKAEFDMIVRMGKA